MLTVNWNFVTNITNISLNTDIFVISYFGKRDKYKSKYSVISFISYFLSLENGKKSKNFWIFAIKSGLYYSEGEPEDKEYVPYCSWHENFHIDDSDNNISDMTRALKTVWIYVIEYFDDDVKSKDEQTEISVPLYDVPGPSRHAKRDIMKDELISAFLLVVYFKYVSR